MAKFPRRPTVVVISAIAIPILALFAWQSWRDHTVRSFCREVHVGMTLADLMDLERLHSIDSSYLVLFDGIDFERKRVAQAH